MLQNEFFESDFMENASLNIHCKFMINKEKKISKLFFFFVKS